MTEQPSDKSGQFTNRELAHCAAREVKQREHVYPRLIYQGRLKAHEAERQIAMMRTIAEILALQADLDEEQERLL